ncbi:hypothetical protein [Microcoleus sp. FACHB-672]|nr:hypothetical protein [Microcoleus sp. FACHB-672]MBD2039864.1 hypothetical protein [Microcoleus sp. FACHB-672]
MRFLPAVVIVLLLLDPMSGGDDVDSHRGESRRDMTSHPPAIVIAPY